MHPTLLKIESLSLKFHAYPTMIAIAFLVCTLLAVRDGTRAKPPIWATPRVGLWIFFSALVGAKVYWILQFHGWRYLAHSFSLWEGGLVYYGGLIGGVLGGLVCFYFYKLPPLRSGDIAVQYLALGQAITRIGCFLNGCCWGYPAILPWAVQFPKHSHPYRHQRTLDLVDASALKSLPVHPTQLYMMLGLLLIFVVLKVYHNKHKRYNGQILLLYCLLYGTLRFTVEIFRDRAQGGDSIRSVIDLMTLSQTISLVMAMASFIALYALGTMAFPVTQAEPAGESRGEEAGEDEDEEDDDEPEEETASAEVEEEPEDDFDF